MQLPDLEFPIFQAINLTNIFLFKSTKPQICCHSNAKWTMEDKQLVLLTQIHQSYEFFSITCTFKLEISTKNNEG